ncbi:hypothetical protein [Ruminococcus sp. JE7B6]|uniref:hypothetical protein n=1 Tax=Ruminococcus sp. JE7B6 TaxID=3233380 RepID=UPI00389AF783
MSEISVELYDSGENILNIHANGIVQSITIDMIKSIWRGVSDDELEYIEYVDAEVFDNLVSCCITVASGQGGIVFVWDVTKKQFVHYSNGEFAVKVKVYNQHIYILREISYWGVKAHLRLDICPLGIKSMDESGLEIPLDDEMKFKLADNGDNYFIDLCDGSPMVRISHE